MVNIAMNFNLALIMFLAVTLAFLDFTAAEDTHQNCKMWAEAGECEKNPGYMLSSCKTSCDEIVALVSEDDEKLRDISSFFDLTANDIFGESVEFKNFRNQVTVLVNVGK